MITKRGQFIQINKPEWFKDSNFLSCLEGEWTWWSIQKSPEYWDTIFYYDSPGAGSLDHLPHYIATELEDLLKSQQLNNCLIWITNLED